MDVIYFVKLLLPMLPTSKSHVSTEWECHKAYNARTANSQVRAFSIDLPIYGKGVIKSGNSHMFLFLSLSHTHMLHSCCYHERVQVRNCGSTRTVEVNV